MNKKIIGLVLLFAYLFLFSNVLGAVRIVVLGSSTAYGYGLPNSQNSWVNRYSKFMQLFDSNNEIINLSVPGYTTYHIMPTDYFAPKGKVLRDENHNITSALIYKPQAIIINLPTNDIGYGFSIQEQMNNYKKIIHEANKANVPVWITTPQPRSSYNSIQRKSLAVLKDSICYTFKDKVLDFWTELTVGDGEIKPEYNQGDGIHLNEAGHQILCEKVIAANILGIFNLDSVKNASLFVYPNPSTNIIHFSKPIIIKKLLIIDLQGKIVANYSNIHDEVNLENLNKGLYFFDIIDEKNRSVRIRMVKK